MFGTDLSAIYIMDNNIAPILSESFGSCEASITASSEPFYVDLWQQASAQGITAILSAGDSGSAGCDPDGTSTNQDVANNGIAVSGLASTIYNVALGGTDFQNAGSTQNSPSGASTFWNATNATNGSFMQTSAKGYIPEWPWNDSCAATATTGSLGTCTAAIINPNSEPSAQNFGIDVVAGGGGPSSLTGTGGAAINPKPNYQSGINGMPAANFRQLPDISLFSGNGTNASFYVICQQDANSGTGSSTSSCDLNSPFNDFQGVGGTSAAAPAFAGIMAMVNQKTGQRQGNANFILYQLYKNNAAGTICASAANPASTCIFYDTVLGNNSVACAGGSTNCSNATSGGFGVLVDPTATTKPAYITKTGYDNATGLGSVNVTNLLNAWSSVSFPASTVTITSANPHDLHPRHRGDVQHHRLSDSRCRRRHFALHRHSAGTGTSRRRAPHHRRIHGKCTPSPSPAPAAQSRSPPLSCPAAQPIPSLPNIPATAFTPQAPPLPSPSPSPKKPAPPPSISSPSTPLVTRRSTRPARRSRTAAPTSSKSL